MAGAYDAYPLCWPAGRPRTQRRERARFDTTFARARDEIVHQIELMTGRYDWMRREAGLVISTNIALRRDGLPLAGQRQPDDPAVAVYFNYNGRPTCFACDRWDKVEHNMQAIAKTIDALRGIARWGTGDMLEAAFSGFAALPAPASSPLLWRSILGLPPTCSLGDAERAYRRLRSEHHPDRGGSPDEFDRIHKAWKEAQKELIR